MDPSSTSTCENLAQSEAVVVETGEETDSKQAHGTGDCAEDAGTAPGTIPTESHVVPDTSLESSPEANLGDSAMVETKPSTPESPGPQSNECSSSDGLVVSTVASKEDFRPKTTSPLSVGEQSQTLLSLPIDSLHCIASFSTPSDWSSFSLTGHAAHRVCREIFQRVRMHGFRCATEVVTAWKLAQHADARELTALYIQSGVPIYPYSLGHSYHTLVWRMGVETKEMENASTDSGDEDTVLDVDSSTSEEGGLAVDQFYAERFPALGERFTELNGPNLSYLEEKCVFWHSREAGTDDLNTSGDSQIHRSYPPKLVVKVHRHLADQHLLGKPKIDDENGAMTTPPVSLAADFFHPQFGSNAAAVVAAVAPIDDKYQQNNMTRLLDAQVDLDAASGIPVPPYQNPPTRYTTEGGFVVGGMEDDEQTAGAPLHPFAIPGALPSDSSLRAGASLPPTNDESGVQREAQSPEKSILTDVQLETYTAPSVKHAKIEQKDATGLIRSQLQARFEVYQRRIEKMMENSDNAGIDECLLDFWDEFLALTKNIHFYDRHTAVPRASGLEKFLSKPCPKAVGIIQCEIERIRVSPKKKGVSVKGRLFPTYEYRLFIRDRRSSSVDNSTQEETEPARRDTVLLMAKNRGRNHSGGYAMSSSSKKGVNNYYLYMPQKADIDAHFDSVNSTDSSSEGNDVNNVSPPVESTPTPSLLGRLQSNFTGTEFQIFTPTTVKKGANVGSVLPTNIDASSDGGNELDYDSGVSSDNASFRRRVTHRRRRSNSRLSRGNIEFNDELPQVIEERQSRNRRRSLRRARSLPVIPYGGRSSWTSRRAIAHAVDPPAAEEAQEVTCEEENGAITYTANLLGNRPRIMDVCIPKVTPDGCAGTVWRKYLESFTDTGDVASGNRMLQHFKQLQQRQENTDANNADNPTDASHDGSAEGDNDDFGLLPLQNRPPWWNVELGAFVLNFGGRVSVASVKNFQLCHRNDQDYIMLQFGRTQGRHSFTMDFQYPLTAVQAFAIAISSLQSKISFG